MPLASLHDPPLIAKGQVGFIAYLVRPLYEAYSSFWGATGDGDAPWLGHLDTNAMRWQVISDEAAAEKEDVAAAAEASAATASAAAPAK